MKSLKIRLFAGIALCLFVTSLSAQVAIVPSEAELQKPFGASDKVAFEKPDKIFYPETWFHYVGGNVSKKGITADLEAIAAAGISGIQLFHGQADTAWTGVTEQITCLSEKWDDMVKHTGEECRRLGLRLTMQGCPGWAMAGGPWIKSEDAMRDLVWSRTDVAKDAKNITLPLPQPSSEEWRDYKDIAVLAFPTPENDVDAPLLPSEIYSNVKCDWSEYLHGTAKNALKLESSSPGHNYWIDVVFPKETIVRTIVVPSAQMMNHNWCYVPGVNIRVQAIMNDGSSTDVLHTDMPQSNWQDDMSQTFSCQEVKGCKKYRIVIKNNHEISLKYIKLYSAARKNNWESEAAWALRSIEHNGDTIKYSPAAYVHSDKIMDLSDRMSSDGTLHRFVPDGNWTILRVGHVNSGRVNAPAPREATGWECDKYSLTGSNAQFDGYLGRISGAEGPLNGNLLNGMLFDSWECKTQTWTKQMENEFESRTKYPLRKWLPAIFGYVIDDTETTFRFLTDWRRTINSLLVDNFYGNLSERAHERGVSLSFETASGDVFPADILEYYKYADVPMCEFWQPFQENFVGSLNFKPIKPAASAARIYGKPRVGAEAFTSFQLTWNESFQDLKDVADVNMVEGVSHLIFHTYTHNPQVDFKKPGTSFGFSNIGSPFLRGQTWWKYMSEFTTYLARCSYMLERGKPVSDVLWFLGDEIDHKPDQEYDFPKGFKYDYCNTDALIRRISVKDGKLQTPEGITYSLLWIPSDARMLPETLDKIYELINDGATVVGNAPKGIATLAIQQSVVDKFDNSVRKIWSSSGLRTIGKGRIISGISLEEALNMLNMQPDVKDTEAIWLHRKVGNTDWYFVCTPKMRAFSGTLDFRAVGNVQMWNPVTGDITELPCSSSNGRTRVNLDMQLAGSCFIVFNADKSLAKPETKNRIIRSIPLQTDWNLAFPAGWGAPEKISLPTLKAWKDLDISDEGKAFSGTAEYSTQFKLPKIDKNRSYILDLSKVVSIAEVFVNGKKAGTLWTTPYTMDITDYVQKGNNNLVVKVTNNWFNRLVYDSAQNASDRKTWTTKYPDKNTSLFPSGLLGPVSVKVME